MTLRELKRLYKLVGRAYEIGHAHGSNPMRVARGQDAIRVNEGWGPIADSIARLIKNKKPSP